MSLAGLAGFAGLELEGLGCGAARGTRALAEALGFGTGPASLGAVGGLGLGPIFSADFVFMLPGRYEISIGRADERSCRFRQAAEPRLLVTTAIFGRCLGHCLECWRRCCVSLKRHLQRGTLGQSRLPSQDSQNQSTQHVWLQVSSRTRHRELMLAWLAAPVPEMPDASKARAAGTLSEKAWSVRTSARPYLL